MAPLPRRRYSRIPVGLVETLPTSIAQTKPSALVLLLWLLLSPFRRTLPGVVRAGEIMLADSLGWSPAAVRRHRSELESAGLVSVDTAARIWWVRSAIGDDPPRNENTLAAWAADLAELPACPIRDAIRDEISRVVSGLEKGDSLLPKWKEASQGTANSSANSHGNSSRNSWGTPVPQPSPQPSPQPPPQPPAGVAEAWGRLPSPPFAAAAAKDLARVEEVLGLPTYASLLQELTCSKWLNASKFNLTGGTPTLRGLLGKADLVQRICAGEFRDPGLQPSCARCRADHSLLDACPPRCGDCEAHHDGSYKCEERRRREEIERQAELWNQQRPDLAIAEEVHATSMASVAAEGEPPPTVQRLREMLPAALRRSAERAS